MLRHILYSTDTHSGLAVVTRDETSQTQMHAKHCLDYLRQSLICTADSTLEPVDATTDTVSGMHVVHQCRDFEGLKTWTEEHQYTE